MLAIVRVGTIARQELTFPAHLRRSHPICDRLRMIECNEGDLGRVPWGFLRFLAVSHGSRIAMAVILACAWTSVTDAEDAIPAAAVFDFELFDTSLEGEMRGEDPDEQQRLILISDLLRRLLSESGRFHAIDLDPAAAQIADVGQFRGCNGCDVAIARDLGAELAITGVVQKVSNLILNINIYVQVMT